MRPCKTVKAMPIPTSAHPPCYIGIVEKERHCIDLHASRSLRINGRRSEAQTKMSYPRLRAEAVTSVAFGSSTLVSPVIEIATN